MIINSKSGHEIFTAKVKETATNEDYLSILSVWTDNHFNIEPMRDSFLGNGQMNPARSELCNVLEKVIQIFNEKDINEMLNRIQLV